MRTYLRSRLLPEKPGAAPVVSILPVVSSFIATALLLFCGVCQAHFKLNLNIRVVHVEHVTDGLEVYIRLPMPYLLADQLGPVKDDGSRDPAPFTTNKTVDGELMHYIDYAAIKADPFGLGKFVVNGHELRSGENKLSPEIISVSVHTGDSQPPFSTLSEAKSAFANSATVAISPPPFVGDAVVDVWLQYRGDLTGNYKLSSSLNPGLPGQEDTANLIVDYANPQPRIFRITGLMSDPVEISRSSWAAAVTFIKDGVHHILSGYDHVLFVVCLVLGATLLPTMLWRVTGFTVGHMFTLSLGFFGYVPTAVWFIPLVESGIAISIIIAAVYALTSTRSDDAGLGKGVVITVLIGMLHGLGFSFILREILGVNSPNLWVSLMSFNIGVELGQLGIVLLLWPFLYLIARFVPVASVPLKWLIALPCIGLAAYWTGQRGIEFINAVL